MVVPSYPDEKYLGQTQGIDSTALSDNFELLESASERDGFQGRERSSDFLSGRAEKIEPPEGPHSQAPPEDTDTGECWRCCLNGGPVTFSEFTSSRGIWVAPKLSSSRFSKSLQMPEDQRFRETQKVPLCYLQICSRTLFSSLTHKRHTGSQLESVLWFMTQTRAGSSKLNGQGL